MRKLWTEIGVWVLASAFTQGVLAIDVTIADPHRDKEIGTNLKTGPGLPENGRVEWNAVANQTWDLESFTLSGSQLGMSGGFNYLSGMGQIGSGFYKAPMGDIFVYIGKVPYTIPDGPEDHDGPWTGAGNWDYVIAFERDTVIGPNYLNIKETSPGSGKVNYGIFSSGTYATTSGGLALNSGLPWRWTGSGTHSLQADYTSFSDGEGTHYSLANIDLSGILAAANGQPVYLHATMQCGNDVMWGKVSDGGLTVALLGLGMAGLGLLARRHSE
jgi:hypothetical protein